MAFDPGGSVIFASMLFTGSISDKEIFVHSGLLDQLKSLIEMLFLKKDDGIMGTERFNTEAEVAEIGLKLNIPPYAMSGTQKMSQRDVIYTYTHKNAKYRVHVEYAIPRIKSFKVLGGGIALFLLSSINQIWYVCCFFDKFMHPCIKTK